MPDLHNKESYDRWLHLMYILEKWRVIQMLRRGMIFRLVYPLSILGSCPTFYGSHTGSFAEILQFVAVDPDLVVTFFLGFVKDQFQAKVKMGLFNVVGVFFGAVTGAAHIANDISGLNEASFF
mgnify:CR=1 FL=1